MAQASAAEVAPPPSPSARQEPKSPVSGLSDAERAALAEQLGYRSIGKDLPDDVTLSKVVSSMPKDVSNPVKRCPTLRIYQYFPFPLCQIVSMSFIPSHDLHRPVLFLPRTHASRTVCAMSRAVLQALPRIIIHHLGGIPPAAVSPQHHLRAAHSPDDLSTKRPTINLLESSLGSQAL